MPGRGQCRQRQPCAPSRGGAGGAYAKDLHIALELVCCRSSYLYHRRSHLSFIPSFAALARHPCRARALERAQEEVRASGADADAQASRADEVLCLIESQLQAVRSRVGKLEGALRGRDAEVSRTPFTARLHLMAPGKAASLVDVSILGPSVNTAMTHHES